MTTQEKIELAELMKQVHGIYYTFGWICRAWCMSEDTQVEDAVNRATRDELLLKLTKKETHNE